MTVIALFSALHLIFVMTAVGRLRDHDYGVPHYETGFNQVTLARPRSTADSLRDHRHRRRRTASTHRIKRMTTLMPPKRQRKIGRWISSLDDGRRVIMLYPFWIMIITSLKSESQFLSGGGFSWLSCRR